MLDNYRGSRCLITGGLGFIGSSLAKRLVELGAKVTIIDSMVPEYGGSFFNIAGFEEALHVNISDVRDPHSMRQLLAGQDFLFNLAGQTSHLDSMRDPFTDLDINSRAQLSILESCRQYNPSIRVVFASTRQIYGRPDYLPVNEAHPLRPVDVNGVNKMSGEAFHTLYHQAHHLSTVVLRLTNTIGPGMRVKDARQTFVGIWIRRLLEGSPIEVWGGEQIRDFNYVDDAVDAFLLAGAKPEAEGKIFNLGSSEKLSLKELAELLIEINGSGTMNLREFPAERKAIDIGDYYSDHQSITSTLGWQPTTTLRKALTETLAFYRLHLDRYL